ncbi:MAG: hypothetical protein AAF518_04560 [Spirochaetota bacterium]
MSNIPDKEALKSKLKIFLEAYMKTKIIDMQDGAFIMYIRLSHNKNNTMKEKFINYKLLRLQERLFSESPQTLTLKDAIVCEFLIEELYKYVTKSLKK